MTTPSKNHAAILSLALTKICKEKTIYDFCNKYQFDVENCYKNATEIAGPGKLLAALDAAEQEIAEKEQNNIKILTLFDYQDSISKNYIYYQGEKSVLFYPRFTINMSHASNGLALKVEEILEALAENLRDQNLVMVGGASSSFASCVRYRECKRPVIMTTEKDLGNFRNNVADCIVYDARPSTLNPVPVTFDLISVDDNLRHTIVSVGDHEINVTLMGLPSAISEIIKKIMEENKKNAKNFKLISESHYE